MFTSFGLPTSISHRKGSSNPRKKYNSIYGTAKAISTLKPKKTKVSFQPTIPKPKKLKQQQQ
jgi:hypothetical protein